MKSRWLGRLTVVTLVVALAASLILNVTLFQQGRGYYVQLNASHLDPLGLGDYPVEAAQSGQRTVVFLGDSRAFQWPAPSLAQFEFANRGIGNQTTSQVILRFDAHVKPLKPQVVILQVGINDLKTVPLFPDRKETIIANCKSNIRQLGARSRGLGATVVLTTIFPVGEVPLQRQLFWSDEVRLAVDQVNADIRSLADEQVIVLDAFALLVGKGGLIQPEYSFDALHLNARGYATLNSELSRVLAALD